ncbi:MAG: hypothetical protein IAE94_11585 [Chthoniobacterales bacterium]|nr:hypothetical protein [Chthoniobacterales bacterium]
MKKLFGLLLAFSISTVSLCGAAETIFSENFNDLAPGDLPLATFVGNPGMIAVADATTEPADPFGPKENRSLRLMKRDADERVVPRVTWTVDEISEGTLSFKGWTTEKDEFKIPLLAVFLYQDTLAEEGATAGPAFYFGGTSLRVWVPEGFRDYPAAWRLEEVNSVVVRFSSDKTYTLEINGERFPDADTKFPFRGNVDTINRVQFAIADSRPLGALTFVDDIELKRN